MVWFFCYVGGISICIVWNKFILFVKNNLSILFKFEELELFLFMKGVVDCKLGISGEVNLYVWVWVYWWLFWIVLILLLCVK